jgi:hypothetical protein
MKVLVACEESQVVTAELRKRGHEAYSCDLLPCSGELYQWHIQGDVVRLLEPNAWFYTMDGKSHHVDRWDMIIAFPPCTYLTCAGACNIPRDPSRIEKGREAAKFFYKIWTADCPRIAIENPRPMGRFNLPPPSEITYPYEFGHDAIKPTYLWLKGLPPLKPQGGIRRAQVSRTIRVRADGSKAIASTWYYRKWEKGSRSMLRSKTFPNIAKAMAEQWGQENLFGVQITWEGL